MANPAFSLHLGEGVYLDSDGNVTQGVPPTAVVYEAEFKIPIDPKKAAAALKDVSEALKDVDKNKEVVEKINEIYGFFFGDASSVDPKALLSMLAFVSKIAGTIAPVLLVVGFALDVVKLLGIFKDGPSAFEQLVKKRFEELSKNDEVITQLIKDRSLIAGRNAIEKLTADANDYVNKLNNTNPNPAELQTLFTNLSTSFNVNLPAIQALIDAQTWRSLFVANRHSQIWGLMQNLLFLFPNGRGMPPVPAHFPSQPNQFDHRLMVPMSCYAGHAFLACLRALVPEYRSTGDSRGMLKNLARDYSNLAHNMRREVLARTIYKAKDFEVLLDEGEVLTTSDFLNGPQPVAMGPLCGRFPVGALDLRYHDNLFFESFLAQLSKAEFFGWERTTKRATMDFRWLPPAKLMVSRDVNGKRDGYRITNGAECAEAANAQSELDYAELLSVSGYSQLQQMATLFRNESTDPDRSQTVQVFPAALSRSALPATDERIESEPVPLSGKITWKARREPQRCSASIEVWTQPLGRIVPIQYKIQLRTLKSIWGDNRWREPLYSAFQFVHYEPDLADRTFMKMLIDERDNAVDAHKIAEGPSPAGEAKTFEDTIKLKAHTFDWWIPLKPPFQIDVAIDKTLHKLRGFGNGSVKETQLIAANRKQSVSEARFARVTDTVFEDSIPKLAFLNGAQDWEGEHRELREEEVTLEYRATWNGDRMHIELEADPVDRNYIVYVVVEEQLQGDGGNVLHTAIPVAVNGQLTYVPQAFFDAERAAIEKAAKASAEFARKYAKSKNGVSPGDPVIGWLRPGDLASVSGLTKVISLARQHEPELLNQVLTGFQDGPSGPAE